jgi:hypothetical protein
VNDHPDVFKSTEKAPGGCARHDAPLPIPAWGAMWRAWRQVAQAPRRCEKRLVSSRVSWPQSAKSSWRNAIELVQVLFGQGNLRGAKVLAQMRNRRCPRNQENVR